VAVLDVIADERLVEHAGRVGARLRQALEAVLRRHGAAATVRGRGLLVGVELDGGGELAAAVVDGMRERGVLIGRTGPRGDVLKVRPPLRFGDAEVAVLAEAVDGALEDALRGR
jgi:4-aminobutyrate aminotransferase-like enzyme